MAERNETSLHQLIHSIALDGFDTPKDSTYLSNPFLKKIKDLDSELWIDTGDLEYAKKLWKTELSALTTNNTLANQVVQTGVMDTQIQKAIKTLKESEYNLSEKEMVFEIGFIINCKIALRLVQEFNAKVSVELHPAMAKDMERSLSYARRYFRVCPENFTIKIPLTPEGLLAVRKLISEYIPINFTLGFSARQNYLAGLLSNPTYVNVFLGRLNAVVSDNGLGDGKNVGEKVTRATQNALDDLKNIHPAVNTRLIAASIRNSDQIIDLSGINVLTIPPKALEDLMSSDKDPEAIASYNTHAFPVSINETHEEQFRALWEVSSEFKAFADRVVNSSPDTITGEDLVSLCESNNIDLFHRFSDQNLLKIKNDGKIPKLNDWADSIAIDDLMTVSALQSFAKDQEALDARIKNFIQ